MYGFKDESTAELVKELKSIAWVYTGYVHELCEAAAIRLEELEARLKWLEDQQNDDGK